MTEVDEGGLRPQRGEFVRESTYGEVPADPSWESYSDAIQSFSVAPDANTARQDGLGDPRPLGFFANSETHEAEVVYHLQRWFVDGSGDPVDASADGILRNADNAVENSHSAVFREEHTTGTAGTADSGRRIYYVCKGGKIGQIEVPFVTDRSLPIETTVSYQFQKIRPYDVSQPSGDLSSGGTVESTDASDTSQTLTLEDEGANTTEDVSLNGQTQVSITSPLTDLDAAELDAETTGNVLVKDGSGNTLLTIYGQDAYEHNEGDLGIPALGSGSHAGSIGSSYEVFSGDTLTATTGSLGGTGARIISGAMTVSNSMSDDAQEGTPKRYWFAEEQTIELGAEVAGPVANAEMIRQQLQSVLFDVDWTADGGTVSFIDGELMDPGEAVKEANAARDTMDQTFEFSDITLST